MEEIIESYQSALSHLNEVKKILREIDHRHATEYGVKILSIEVGLQTDIAVLTGNHNLFNLYKGDPRNVKARYMSGNI